MKISDRTISILKNFSQINPSIMFKEGNVLRTMHPAKTIIAQTKITENFDKPVGVYNLGRFLATLSLFDDPDISLGDKGFTIQDSKSKMHYIYCAENMIVSPPEKDIVLPSIIADISVTWQELKKVLDAASVLGLPEISFSSNGQGVSISAVDSKNMSQDTFIITSASSREFEPFDMVIKTEFLKIVESDYDIALSSKGMAHFATTGGDEVKYWVSASASTE